MNINLLVAPSTLHVASLVFAEGKSGKRTLHTESLNHVAAGSDHDWRVEVIMTGATAVWRCRNCTIYTRVVHVRYGTIQNETVRNKTLRNERYRTKRQTVNSVAHSYRFVSGGL